MKSYDLSLYLVTNRSLCYHSMSLGRPLEETIVRAVEGGVTMVQLREQNCTSREFFETASRLKNLLKKYQIPLIISDRIDVAMAVDAEGVHLDRNEIPYNVARKLLGNKKIIGLTVENLEQISEANNYDVDYIVVAPVYYTASIIDAKSAFGIKGLARAVELSRHPVLAEGGINKHNLEDLIKLKIRGVAVSSSIISSKDPHNSARVLKNHFEQANNRCF